MPTLKQRLQEPLVGSWISTGSHIVAELMSQAGFDFLVLDAEHGNIDPGQAQQLFQAIRSGNRDCACLVRLPGNDYATTKRYLDAGAVGVLCPLVTTAEQARELVQAVKFPPTGRRGVGFARCNDYGYDLDHYLRHNNEDSLVIVQIEHRDAVDNIEAIMAVDGVDGLIIGPYDLTASMGIAAQFDDPRYAEACERIASACKKAGKILGTHVVQPDPDQVRQRLAEGYGFIAYSVDITLLGHACRDGLAAIRAKPAVKIPHNEDFLV